ncbi:hypothetical protein DENSPDRAFT_887079 [Dentipellis sp. KUC8613]|nr:hypothetical protein DENSPDRAFT_887079 [Dentipellis sp. KUC8613]
MRRREKRATRARRCESGMMNVRGRDDGATSARQRREGVGRARWRKTGAMAQDGGNEGEQGRKQNGHQRHAPPRAPSPRLEPAPCRVHAHSSSRTHLRASSGSRPSFLTPSRAVASTRALRVAPSFPRLRALFAPSSCPSRAVVARLRAPRLVSLVPSRPSRRRRAVVVAPTSTRLRAPRALFTPVARLALSCLAPSHHRRRAEVHAPSRPSRRHALHALIASRSSPPRPLFTPVACLAPSRASPRRAPRPVAPLRLVLVAPSRPSRPQLLASRPLGLFVSPRPPLRAVAPVPRLCTGRASSRPRCTLVPARAVLAPSRLRAVVAPPRRHAGVVCSHQFQILAPLLPHPPSHPLCARVT